MCTEFVDRLAGPLGNFNLLAFFSQLSIGKNLMQREVGRYDKLKNHGEKLQNSHLGE